MSEFMTIQDALDIVLELAKGNMIDESDMPEEHQRQKTAINTVEDFYCNNLGDD